MQAICVDVVEDEVAGTRAHGGPGSPRQRGAGTKDLHVSEQAREITDRLGFSPHEWRKGTTDGPAPSAALLAQVSHL